MLLNQTFMETLTPVVFEKKWFDYGENSSVIYFLLFSCLPSFIFWHQKDNLIIH